jgi:anti-anti-sigma factor
MAIIATGQFQLENVEGIHILSFSGPRTSIHGELMEELTSPLLDMTQEEAPRLLLDLAHVDFFNSGFIELLIRLWNRMKNKPDGQFAMCSVDHYCMDILEITNMTSVIPIYSNRTAALFEMRRDS